VLGALVLGLAAIALGIALTLSGAPLSVVGSNAIAPDAEIGSFNPCQVHQTVPGGTTAVRLWIKANIGPSVHITVLSGARVLARGTREAGWTGGIATVPIERVARTATDARVCVVLGPTEEAVTPLGGAPPDPAPGEVGDEMRVEYLAPSGSSWWSLAGAVKQHIGLGRAPSGALVALIPLALMALAAILTAWTILRRLGGTRGEDVGLRGGHARLRGGRVRLRGGRVRLRGGRVRLLGGRVPGPAAICACVALLSAASWSILTPPFQLTDEPSHFSYAQIVAETGGLPTSDGPDSQEELAVLEALDHQEVNFNPTVGTISTAVQQQHLQSDLTAPLSRRGSGAGVASPQPPLYYALEAIPYKLAGGGTLLDQLALMRLLSALMGGLTAFFGYLFLREALPAVPWAWTVGGLTLALAPLLGFISGGVTPDAMLCTVSTALFYCLARAFRRGLTLRAALAIGAVTAVGSLTKLNFIGLVPGLVLALAILTRRALAGAPGTWSSRLRVLRLPVLALALGAAPACLYVLINLLSGRAGLGLLSSGIGLTGEHQGSPGQELSYIWQFYLPRLPGMANYFPGISPLRQIWFDRSVALYGWLDTYFSARVDNLALVPASVIAALCARALFVSRGALWRRRGELCAYAAIGVGVLALVGADSYLSFPTRAGGYSEPRYLLPLAALFAAVLALAARGAGRRGGPAVGTLIVLLILAHDIFSQLLVVGRYYV
jgi:Predicted membrane protein (DUF2142)